MSLSPEEFDANLLNIRSELGAITRRLEQLEELDKWEPMTEQERERIHERSMEKTESELVAMLLSLHKAAEQRASGRARELLEREAVLLTSVLDRVAPVALGDALAMWEEHRDEEDGDDAYRNN